MIGDPAVRSRGTIGGNIAHADPASDLPTVLVALDARIVVVGPSGERTIAADGFFTGIMTTTLADNEVLTAIAVPVAGARAGLGLCEVLPSRVALRRDRRRRHPSRPRATSARRHACRVGGLVPHARRAAAVEKALGREGRSTPRRLPRRQDRSDRISAATVSGDIFASASYRKAVAPVYVKRAIAAAAARAGLA
jgi:carbon-monoxide dehydrogenase medium subunit